MEPCLGMRPMEGAVPWITNSFRVLIVSLVSLTSILNACSDHLERLRGVLTEVLLAAARVAVLLLLLVGFFKTARWLVFDIVGPAILR
jgi:hypothetical protein